MSINDSIITIKEEIVSFSDNDLQKWYKFDRQLMSEKLTKTSKDEIKNRVRQKPALHHFPTNFLRVYYQELGYNALPSESGWDEYELFKHDERIARWVDPNQYQAFLQTRNLLRKAGLIRSGGEPDLFVFNHEEAFFVEAKRVGPNNSLDNLHDNQRVIILMIHAFLGLSTKIVAVVHEDTVNYLPRTHRCQSRFSISHD